jgi:Secretion system C-terminal sorting domain
MHNKILISIILLSSFAAQAQKIQQQVVNTSGETFSNNEIAITSSVGENLTATLVNNNNIVSQGFIQPIKSDLPTSLKAYEKMDDNFTLFPNPSVGFFSLEMSNQSTILNRVDVYASDGRLIISKTITTNLLDISSLPDGIYWVHPISVNKQFSLKKIIITH